MRGFATYDPEDGGVVRIVRAGGRAAVKGDRGRGRRPDGWCSTRASASPSGPSTTGPCCAGWTSCRAWACRCSSAPAASRSWGRLLGSGAENCRPPDERDAATTALTTWLALRHPSVWGVRVHDVQAEHADALAVLETADPTELEGAAPMTHEGTDEFSITGLEVLRPPRRLRLRAARRAGVRDRPHAGSGHPRPAATSDDLQDITVDYGSLVAAVKAAVERDPVDLIETLAARIADLCVQG